MKQYGTYASISKYSRFHTFIKVVFVMAGEPQQTHSNTNDIDGLSIKQDIKLKRIYIYIQINSL